MTSLVVMSTCVQLALSSTHWVVSDDGRLKSVDFSPYVMRDSGDLINLMKQEERVSESVQLEKEKERLIAELKEMSQNINLNSHRRKRTRKEGKTKSNQHKPNVEPSEAIENDVTNEQYKDTVVTEYAEGFEEEANEDYYEDEESVESSEGGMNLDEIEENCANMFANTASRQPTLLELDHYYSITLPLELFEISLTKHLGTHNPPSLVPEPPHCNKRELTNPDNLHQFRNLKGIKESLSFVLRPEPSLRAIFRHENLDQVGHLINRFLQQEVNDESWITYNLATIFWRIKGDSVEALNCISNAIDISPSDKLAIALMHMAAILHKHYYHADAQFVAWVALETCNQRARGFIHLFLANVQCLPTLNQWDNCVESLRGVLDSENFLLDEGKRLYLHTGIKEKVKAVTCIKQFRHIVEKEQSVLEQMVLKEKELQTVSEKHAEKLKEIESYKVSDEEILVREHYYRLYTNKQFSQLMDYMQKIKNNAQGHNALLHSTFPNMHFEHLNMHKDTGDQQTQQQWGKFSTAPQFAQGSAEGSPNNRPQGVNGGGGQWSNPQQSLPNAEHFKNDLSDKSADNDLSAASEISEETLSAPTDNQKVNSEWKRSDVRDEEPRVELTSDDLIKFNEEVSRELTEKGGCEHYKTVTTLNTNRFIRLFTSRFIPLPILGFSIRYALTVGIGVDSNQQHPLPWYPPTCPTITPPDGGKGGKSEWVDFAAMLGKWSKTSSNYEAETHLKKHFAEVFAMGTEDGSWNEQDTDAISVGEMGQRIQTAITQKVEPVWAIVHYASLFWRVTGNPFNALHCLNYVYITAPHYFRDVILANVINVLYRAERWEDVVTVANLLEDKGLNNFPASSPVYYSLAVAFVASGQYRDAELVMEQSGILEKEESTRSLIKEYVAYIACQHLFIAEQCVLNEDKSSPQCQNAHAVVDPTLDKECDCAKDLADIPTQTSAGSGPQSPNGAASLSIQVKTTTTITTNGNEEQCGGGGGGSDFGGQDSSNKCSSNVHITTKIKNTSGGKITWGVVQRPQSSPKVPESLRGAQLPEEVTSRQSAMSSMNTDSSHYSGGSSIQTRAICEQRFEVHSCVYYRRFELGSPSCNHPRACDPNVFDDPSQTIIADSSARAIEIYGKDLYDVEFMAIVDSKQTVEMIFYMEEALAQPFDLVMTVFYKEKSRASPHPIPRVVSADYNGARGDREQGGQGRRWEDDDEQLEEAYYEDEFQEASDADNQNEDPLYGRSSEVSGSRVQFRISPKASGSTFEPGEYEEIEAKLREKLINNDQIQCPAGSVEQCNSKTPQLDVSYNVWAPRGPVWSQLTNELTKYCELELQLSQRANLKRVKERQKERGVIDNNVSSSASAATTEENLIASTSQVEGNLEVEMVPKFHDLSIMFTPTTPSSDVMFQSLLMTEETCSNWPHTSVSASSSLIQPSVFKYKVDDVIDWNKEVKVGRALHVPVCVNTVGKSPIDHFVGVKQRGASASQYKGEKTLRDAFLSLSNYRLSLKQMADRLAQALDENADSFVLLNLAVTYWRIVGNSQKAIDCIRQALYYSPMRAKPIAWIALANILQRSGFLDDAHFFSFLSLRVFPSFTTYATTANIRANQRSWPDSLAYYEGARLLNPDMKQIITDMKTVQCLRMHDQLQEQRAATVENKSNN
ncbi:uncharacterized protein LOC142353123 isoform X3 [Convolutriloba macropyga]|uniref:uncharacterized protein LOC142353123 isoform X3 n=1 Tax=Convolutriloba macropyga TaxID=536237 RepID=UPI003F51C801